MTHLPSKFPAAEGLVVHEGGTHSFFVPPGKDLVVFNHPKPSSDPSRFEIETAEGARVFFRGLYLTGDSGNLKIVLKGRGSKADVRTVVVSSNGSSHFDCHVVSAASDTEQTVLTSAFALPGGDIETKTVADVLPGIGGAKAEARQSNVFFGASGKIRGIPELRVGTDDVKARHSCTVERFSEEKLFYLRSRGLSHDAAMASLLSASVSDSFSGLPSGCGEWPELYCRSALSAIVGAG